MDARTWEVVSPRSTDEPVEQGFSCGGGGEGGEPRGNWLAVHAPDTLPDRAWHCRQTGHAGRVPGTGGVLIASLPSPSLDVGPEAGTQCGRPARWGLCEGPPVSAVPTATPCTRRQLETTHIPNPLPSFGIL
jgi:hypothetical protein